MKTRILAVLAVLVISAAGAVKAEPMTKETDKKEQGESRATFAGGCFWCMEPPFDQLKGVTATIPGYTGGKKKNPTYEEVSAGVTGHTEAVQVVYDPAQVTYQQLLEVFWRNVDPTVEDRQFVDVGSQYRTGIFTHDDQQKNLAEASKDALAKSGRFDKPLVTEITPLTDFYPAEDYHMDYYLKNPLHYKRYRRGSGRDQYLEKTWGDDKKGKD